MCCKSAGLLGIKFFSLTSPQEGLTYNIGDGFTGLHESGALRPHRDTCQSFSLTQ